MSNNNNATPSPENSHGDVFAINEEEKEPDLTKVFEWVNSSSSKDVLDKAKKILVQAQQDCEKKMGYQQIEWDIARRIALIHISQGELGDAKDVVTEVHKKVFEKYGFLHVQTLDTFCMRGEISLQQGFLDEAEQMFELALQGVKAQLEYFHPTIRKVFRRLNRVYEMRYNHEQVEEMFQQTLQYSLHTYGHLHASTLSCYYCFGLMYTSRRKLEDAEVMFAYALQGYEMVLGRLPIPSTSFFSCFNLLRSSQGELNSTGGTTDQGAQKNGINSDSLKQFWLFATEMASELGKRYTKKNALHDAQFLHSMAEYMALLDQPGSETQMLRWMRLRKP